MVVLSAIAATEAQQTDVRISVSLEAKQTRAEAQGFKADYKALTEQLQKPLGQASSNLGSNRYASRTAHHYLEWAYGLGTATAEVVKAQFHGKEEFSIAGSKACQQLQHLAKQYGNARLEAACVRVLAIQSPTVKSLRSILQHRLDKLNRSAHPVATLIPPHANVRGPDYYAGESRHE